MRGSDFSALALCLKEKEYLTVSCCGQRLRSEVNRKMYVHHLFERNDIVPKKMHLKILNPRIGKGSKIIMVEMYLIKFGFSIK